MDFLINLHLRLMDKSNGQPLTGNNIYVRFMDEDMVEDDFLGEASPNENGEAVVAFTRDDIRSWDSMFEKYPDIYFEVYKDGLRIYKSDVFQDLHVEETDSYPDDDGLSYELGTYLIPTS